MRLSHSISMTLFASLLTALSACSSDSSDDGGGTSGGGTSGTGGTAGAGMSGSGGTAGSGAGGTGGSGMSGAGGTGGSGTSGSGGGGVVDHPTDTTQAGIEAYLAMESYKIAGNGWRPESMPGDPASLPHLATMRYFNNTIIASKAAGGRPPGMQHTPGSMSIKEILEGTTVIGKATTLRTDANQWIFYCKSSVGARCGTGVADNTAYYATAAGPCACHGSGTNISHDAIPAPQ